MACFSFPIKEEAYLSKGRMLTLNKEMSLQDVHMLLSIKNKQLLHKKSIEHFYFWKFILTCGLPPKEQFTTRCFSQNVLHIFAY